MWQVWFSTWKCKEQTHHQLQHDVLITPCHNPPLQLELHTTFKILPMSSFLWEIEEVERIFRCRAGQLLFCYIPQIWLLPLLRTCRVTAFVQPVIPSFLIICCQVSHSHGVSRGERVELWLSFSPIFSLLLTLIHCTTGFNFPLFLCKLASSRLLPSVLGFISVSLSAQQPMFGNSHVILDQLCFRSSNLFLYL